MAIIHTTPRQSGTEGLIRLLDSLTDEIVLKHGKILMSQFSHGHCGSLKLSLFVSEDILDQYIGIRNVFIEDVAEGVAVRFADRLQTEMSLETLRQTKRWDEAFPSLNRSTYPLTELDKGAVDVRDYLLLGRLPGQAVSDELMNLISKAVPDSGFIEFDIVASLMDYDI